MVLLRQENYALREEEVPTLLGEEEAARQKNRRERDANGATRL